MIEFPLGEFAQPIVRLGRMEVKVSSWVAANPQIAIQLAQLTYGEKKLAEIWDFASCFCKSAIPSPEQ